MRIRLGDSWKFDVPRIGEDRSLVDTLHDIVGVLHIEVDGVDIAQGLAETRVYEALRALDAGLDELGPASRASTTVHLPDAPVELLIRRDASDVFLTVRLRETLTPIASDVQTEWKSLCHAARRASTELWDDAARLSGRSDDEDSGLATAASTEGMAGRPPPTRRRRRTLPFDRRTERTLSRPAGFTERVAFGRLHIGITPAPPLVSILDEGDRVVWSKAGPPLPTLVALARASVDASPLGDVLIDRRLLTVRFGPNALAPLGALRDALSVLADRNAAWRDELTRALHRFPSPFVPRALEAADARPRRQRPARTSTLPNEGLRRLSLAPAWSIGFGGEGLALANFKSALVITNDAETALVDARGRERWRREVAQARVVTTSEGAVIVAHDADGTLSCIDGQTGESGRRTEAAFDAEPKGAWTLADDSIALLAPRRLVVIPSNDGRKPWSYESPNGSPLLAARAWAGVVVGSARGELVALDAEGRLAWSGDPGLVALDHLAVDESAGLLAVTGTGPSAEAAIAVFDLADGALRHRTVLSGETPSAPVFHGTHASVLHETDRESFITTLVARTGRLSWRESVGEARRAALSRVGDRLAVVHPSGALRVLSSRGALHWAFEPPSDTSELEPLHPRPLIETPRMLVTSGAFVHVLDPKTGRRIAHLSPSHLAPGAVRLLDGPVIVTASDDGAVEAFRARGHLSVVS